MIIDLTEKFKKDANIPENANEENPPAKITIETVLCYKKGADLFSSLNKIYSIMLDNQSNYFSNAAYSCEAFTDQQRNQFDQEIKNSLNITNMGISEFKNVIEEMKTQNVTEKQHMRGIALCIYQLYKNISKLFREFLQFNENRKRKLQSAISLEIKNEFKFKNQKTNNKETNLIKRKQSLIDQELERESKLIYMQKISEHKKIEDTKKTLEKINEILDKMQNKVLEQEVLTSSFLDIGQIGLFHIDKGNKNLVQANILSKETGKYWTWYFLSLAFSLLLLDFITS